MDKRRIAALVIAGCIAVGAITLLIRPPRGPRETGKEADAGADDWVQSRVIDRHDEYNQNVRSDIQSGLIVGTDSMGIMNSLPSECNDSTPLIEFRTFERLLDGSVQPFHVVTLHLQSQGETVSGATYGVDGCGLRLALAEKLDWSLYLLWDTEYVAIGGYYRSGDPNNAVEGKADKLTFRTPSDLGPGEIYRVDLVLDDRMKENKLDP